MRSRSWRRTARAPARSPTRSARSSSRTTAARASTSAEAGCNRADVVAAVTGDDEDNLVICQMAKHHFDVPRTIARVNNPKNESLFRHLGVDELISPTRMILGSIEQDIPVHELLHLAALGEGSSRSSRRTCRRARPRSAARRRTSRSPRAARCSPSSATGSRRPCDRRRSCSKATRSSPSASGTARRCCTASSSARTSPSAAAPDADRPATAAPRWCTPAPTISIP